ncbi:hypothetical protein A3A67_00715 [Candidatus Peribacteria bacterium RIFCSPLOWO2_01_FULL_51_18]|nr:MAG: hypothetical protein A3A67_00715 [Candidatus Peribacteria bacterium RIFCSPLOWO2_01_FULL_51_18]
MDDLAILDWCKRKKQGILLIEPNENLFKEYILTAEETLDVLRGIKGKSKVWLATTKYYCEYFAVYALLMRIGIKCEIHECTIALCRLLEDEGIVPSGYAQILDEDKQLRIDNQYYLKNREVPLDYGKLVEFVVTLKGIGIRLSEESIQKCRKRLE